VAVWGESVDVAVGAAVVDVIDVDAVVDVVDVVEAAGGFVVVVEPDELEQPPRTRAPDSTRTARILRLNRV
jgi:hypothetical protein